jgi:hypothetical protein
MRHCQKQPNTKKQPKVDKTPDGAYNNELSYHGYEEISKSTGIVSDFQNSLLFSLFSGNLEPPVFGGLAVKAGLRSITGHGHNHIRRLPVSIKFHLIT